MGQVVRGQKAWSKAAGKKTLTATHNMHVQGHGAGCTSRRVLRVIDKEAVGQCV